MDSHASSLPPLAPGQAQESKETAIIAANVGAASLATAAVVLRLWARRFQSKPFAADDMLIAAALPFAWGMAAATVVAAANGLGHHELAVQAASLVREGEAYFATELLWAVSILLAKLSILLLYVRIFGRVRYFRALAWCIGALTALWAAAVVAVSCLQCLPMQRAWDRAVAGECIDTWAFSVASGAVNAATDVFLLALPLPAVWGLKLGTFQRISLTSIFMLGSLTCVLSVIRLVGVIDGGGSPDSTWALGMVSVWSTAEPCMGITVACLPTMRPLVLHWFRSLAPGRGRRKPPSSTLGMSLERPRRSRPSHMYGGSDLYMTGPRGSRAWEFGDLADSPRMLGTQSRSSVGSPAGDAKEGVIEVRTTWETRHEC